MYVYFILKACARKSTLHFKEAVRLYIKKRSKSVCTTHFGIATAKTSRLFMYVYLVLKACARESTLQRSSQAIHVCIPLSKRVCMGKYTSKKQSGYT